MTGHGESASYTQFAVMRWSGLRLTLGRRDIFQDLREVLTEPPPGPGRASRLFLWHGATQHAFFLPLNQVCDDAGFGDLLVAFEDVLPEMGAPVVGRVWEPWSVRT